MHFYTISRVNWLFIDIAALSELMPTLIKGMKQHIMVERL